MASDDVIHLLDAAAHDGHLDYSKWPRVLQSVISRLDDIVKNTFLIPTLPQSQLEPPLQPSQPARLTQLTSQTSDDTSSTISSQLISSQQTEAVATTNNHSTATSSVTQLPSSLQSFYENIKDNLSTTFAEKPPYTIQRLAELLLIPDKHYRTLPAFLRAVDRIISVSSTSDMFPLPYIPVDTNGVLGSGPDDFNGAALTRIPWLSDASDERSEWLGDSTDMMAIEERPAGVDLRTESTSLIDGPNGAGSVETVTVAMNGTARDIELPARHDSTVANHTVETSEDATDTINMATHQEDSIEDKPHARGPEEIGMEDMGPQATSLVDEAGPADSIQAAERAVGRPGEGERINTDSEGDKVEKDPDSMSLTQDGEEEEETESKS